MTLLIIIKNIFKDSVSKRGENMLDNMKYNINITNITNSRVSSSARYYYEKKEQGVTVYTALDLQEIFKCGKNRAYEIMHLKGFPSFKVCGSYYVEKSALEKWIQKMSQK